MIEEHGNCKITCRKCWKLWSCD